MAEHEEYGRDVDARTPKELALATIAALQQQVREWDAEEARDRQKNAPEPDHRHNKWTVSVRYVGSTEVYEYVILRSPRGGYYTTGIGKEKRFESWKDLIAWLHGKRVAWHGLMRPLVTSSSAAAVLTVWGIR